jgi:hypothetical protein
MQLSATNGPSISANRREAAIGDLSGDWFKFKRWSRAAGCVDFWSDTRFRWIGGDTLLNCAGDMLADRETRGTQIARACLDIRDKARAVGGDVAWFLGNHDYQFVRLLAGKMDVSELNSKLYGNQYNGLKEALAFLPGHSRYQHYADPNADLTQIVPEMKKQPEGQKLLEAISEFRLYGFDPNTGVLYLHTDPVPKVLDLIIEDLDGDQPILLNLMRHYIRHLLGEAIDSQWADYFDPKVESFVDVQNRFVIQYGSGMNRRYTARATGRSAEVNQDNFITECEDKLKNLHQKGVRTICFGHSEKPFYSFGIRGNYMYFSLDSSNSERFTEQPPANDDHIKFIALDRGRDSVEIIRERVQNQARI